MHTDQENGKTKNQCPSVCISGSKQTKLREEKALAGLTPIGHSGIHIKAELDNPINAAGYPRTTSNPKPSGWGASP